MAELFKKDRCVHVAPSDFAPRGWQSECQKTFAERVGSHHEGQFCFVVAAGVGSGKTSLAAMLACYVLNRGIVRRVVYVCPNKVIVGRVRSEFERFNIRLALWNNGSHSQNGESIGFDGAIITYQALVNAPAAHAKLVGRVPTLVIFDEIHHLGDKLDWGTAAQAAFEHPSACVVGLSGTPFRTDNKPIPFVRYVEAEQEGLRRFQADFTYSLGRSIDERICKRPMFWWLGGEVEITIDGETHRHDFDDPPPPDLANAFLGGAVCAGTGSRLDALRVATDVCRDEGRKLIIFVGGDSGAAAWPTEDAEIILPRELESLGIPRREVVSITSANTDAVRLLEGFGKSEARVLITVNMVSEGVDVPELSAALFLTSITATATTIQRIGRVVRGCEPPEARVFMFRDPRYLKLAEQIEKEIAHAIATRVPRPDLVEAGTGQPRRRRVEAVGLCAWVDGVTIHGRTYSQQQVEAARTTLQAEGMPSDAEHLFTALVLLFGRVGAVAS